MNTTISPLNGAISDRFYCDLDVSNVTLEAAPTPDVSYLLDTNLKLGYKLNTDGLIP